MQINDIILCENFNKYFRMIPANSRLSCPAKYVPCVNLAQSHESLLKRFRKQMCLMCFLIAV